ncbi:MAG TPA: hypothetical protein VIM58_03730 [Candidatus Methylacidiphilales bacterium]
MARKKIVLTPEEEKIEGFIERGELRFLPAEEVAKYVEAAKRSAIVRRGGARPGAGRKPLPVRRVALSCMVSSETMRDLRAFAAREGLSLGAAIDRWHARAR